jgi:hypothetical protein
VTDKLLSSTHQTCIASSQRWRTYPPPSAPQQEITQPAYLLVLMIYVALVDYLDDSASQEDQYGVSVVEGVSLEIAFFDVFQF